MCVHYRANHDVHVQQCVTDRVREKKKKKRKRFKYLYIGNFSHSPFQIHLTL